MTKHVGLLILALLCAVSARAQSKESTQTVSDVVNVAQPITLTNVNALNFGTVIASSASRTVTVTGLSSISGADGSIYTGSNRTTPAAAGFYVTGEPGYYYTIMAPATCTVSHGSASMTVALAAPVATAVDGHSPSGSLNASGTSSQINATGTDAGYDTWAIGGTLTIGANQARGVYTGSFTVTVEYQ